MSTISTHVLDTSRGRPASAVPVALELQNPDESWMQLAHAWTDEDGRVKPFFLLEDNLGPGVYRLIFDTEAYYQGLDIECFYPQVTIAFRIEDATQHYHVPLLLNPYGFSTYRGS